MEQTHTIEARLREEIKMLGSIGAPAILQQFVLRNGAAGIALPFAGGRMEQKMCFMNSVHLRTEEPTFYTEGYVWRKDLPVLIHHAWRSTEDHRVFDPTLIDPEECQYFGVQISDKDLWAQLRVIEHYGILYTHCGLNINFMLKVDEGMKQIIKNFRLNKYNFQL